jgi:hypothetical protein
VRDKVLEVADSIPTIVNCALHHTAHDVQRLTAGLVANLCSGTGMILFIPVVVSFIC